jgi:hypothetical protein
VGGRGASLNDEKWLFFWLENISFLNDIIIQKEWSNGLVNTLEQNLIFLSDAL